MLRIALFLFKKKWQVTHIAPLQPSILAAFLPWGVSTGAGRIRLAAANIDTFELIIYRV